MRQRLQYGCDPELESRLTEYMESLREYQSEVKNGHQPSYSVIEMAKLRLADALLESLDFPVKPLAYEYLIPPSIPANSARPRRSGYVCLMKNVRNGYTKIGFSGNPEYREKCLQSEEPEVVLTHTFQGTMNDERELHIRYAEYRMRGEWFRLSDEQVLEIITATEEEA